MRIATRFRAVLAAHAALLAFSAAPFAQAGELETSIEQTAQRNFAEFLELLRYRNVAAVPADIQRNAEFLQAAFERRGFGVRQLQNAAGRPVVFAELDAPTVGAPTLLLYLHYDGQPVVAKEWSQSDPFEPVIRRRKRTGGWEDVGPGVLIQRPLDRELRIFARSAADDKAPIMMLLTAIDVLHAKALAPAFTLKVLLDGEEEIGSPSLAATLATDLPALRADGLVILDGPLHASGRPTLAFGNRGIAQATLAVYGPRAPMHSGHYGNYVPNPAQRLASLVASMKDDDGRVTIPGYYDGIELTPEDRAALAAVGDDEPALLTRAGIARAERVGANYQEALQYPSLNIRGMAAGGVGASAANVIPSEAVAELDLRTTPETDGRRLFELVKHHIEQRGYHLVDGAPSDEERARYDKLASFELHAVETAERAPMDSAIGRWALEALRSPAAPTPEQPPVRIRMMGGTVPTDVLIDALHLPFVVVPTVNPDNNQHARDENLRIGHFVTGSETIYSLLTTAYVPDERR